LTRLNTSIESIQIYNANHAPISLKGFEYLARTTLHGEYSHVDDGVRLCQVFREVITEGIK